MAEKNQKVTYQCVLDKGNWANGTLCTSPLVTAYTDTVNIEFDPSTAFKAVTVLTYVEDDGVYILEVWMHGSRRRVAEYWSGEG